MPDSLRDALNLFNRHKFPEVIRILEPQVFRFRENFEFFYLLGMSCLFTGDYGGAFSYLKRAVNINENDINTLLGIAAVYLKRGDTGNALRIWLDITDLEPDNPYAQRGLNYLKKNTDADSFSGLSANDKILKFVALPRKKKSVGKIIRVVAITAAVLLSVFLIFIFALRDNIGILSRVTEIFRQEKNNSRPEIPSIELGDRKELTELSGEYLYILTDREIEKTVRDIQDYLYEFRDNMAQREINRILLSNASKYVKDRVHILAQYVAIPNFTNFRDNFTYQDVISEPELYNGCFVLWKGRATNVSVTDELIKLDFLVGYHDEKNLEGIVPVTFDFAVRVTANYPMEILAMVNYADGSIKLNGISIHRLQN